VLEGAGVWFWRLVDDQARAQSARYIRAMLEGSAEPLAAMVLSYLDDNEVGLLPDDPVTEARRNTWCYSVGAGSVDVPAVVAALKVVAAALRQRLATHGSGTFYAWYDQQAGQLRCSLSSFPPEALPFRAPYVVTGDASRTHLPPVS
jgi:hypothetical protein